MTARRPGRYARTRYRTGPPPQPTSSSNRASAPGSQAEGRAGNQGSYGKRHTATRTLPSSNTVAPRGSRPVRAPIRSSPVLPSAPGPAPGTQRYNCHRADGRRSRHARTPTAHRTASVPPPADHRRPARSADADPVRRRRRRPPQAQARTPQTGAETEMTAQGVSTETCTRHCTLLMNRPRGLDESAFIYRPTPLQPQDSGGASTPVYAAVVASDIARAVAGSSPKATFASYQASLLSSTNRLPSSDMTQASAAS